MLIFSRRPKLMITLSNIAVIIREKEKGGRVAERFTGMEIVHFPQNDVMGPR